MPGQQAGWLCVVVTNPEAEALAETPVTYSLGQMA